MEDEKDVERMIHAMSRLHRIGDLPLHVTGLHRGEFAVLTILSDYAERDGQGTTGKDMTSTQLSRAMDVSPAAASQAVSSLVAKGYVARIPDGHDRRITRLVLTDKGAEVTRGTKVHLRALISRVFEQLGAEESAVLVDLFDRASLLILDEMRAIRSGALQCAQKKTGKENACENTSAT